MTNIIAVTKQLFSKKYAYQVPVAETVNFDLMLSKKLTKSVLHVHQYNKFTYIIYYQT